MENQADTAIKLNLGCGDRHMDGYVNIDVRPECQPDLCVNIGVEKLPLDDGTVSEIVAYHSMEHFPNFVDVVEELARVSANGCIWTIQVPYVTSTLHNLANPYHVNPRFTENTFRFWDDIYERERPTGFNLEILDTKFKYREDIWGKRDDWHQIRHMYLNVVEHMTQKIKVLKH